MYGNDSCQRITRMFGCKNDSWFTLKCLMKEYPNSLTYILAVTGILFFAVLLMVAEHPLDRILNGAQDHNFMNALWEAIVTITTVGYGDIYPRTPIGRFIMVFCAIFGVAINAIMVVNMTLMFTMSPHRKF